MTAAPVGRGIALAALAAACGAWHRRARTEQALCALHELRAPLSAISPALTLAARRGELSTPIWRALELELARAARAIEDLERACAGSRRGALARLPASPRARAWRAKGKLAGVVAPLRRVHAVGSVRRGALDRRREDSGPRVERSRIERWEKVDLARLIADSGAAWEACAEERGAALLVRWCGDPAWVRGDRVRLAQLAGNLIANAIEHGGGTVKVEGRVVGRRARIEVSDQGPGFPAFPGKMIGRRRQGGQAHAISPDEQRREHFAQGRRHGLGARSLRGALRRRGLRGRGLAIAARIAADHGGQLELAPARRGARVVLELPLARQGDPMPPGALSRDSTEQDPHALERPRPGVDLRA